MATAETKTPQRLRASSLSMRRSTRKIQNLEDGVTMMVEDGDNAIEENIEENSDALSHMPPKTPNMRKNKVQTKTPKSAIVVSSGIQSVPKSAKKFLRYNPTDDDSDTEAEQAQSATHSVVGLSTPRRSVRKSVKPIQEYEFIVAQKGLAAATFDAENTEQNSDTLSQLPPMTPKMRKSKVQTKTPKSAIVVSSESRSVRKSAKKIQEYNSADDDIDTDAEQVQSATDSVVGLGTPRRSVRKSVKPIQEYEFIVAQKGLAATFDAEAEPARWTPAKVGRVSEKRHKKSRKVRKDKKNQTNDNSDNDVEPEHCDRHEKGWKVENLENDVVKQCDVISESPEDITDSQEEDLKEEEPVSPCASAEVKLECPKESDIKMPLPEQAAVNECDDIDDMPSLIFFDDPEEVGQELKEDSSSTQNVTFECDNSDCVMITPNEGNSSSSQKNEKESTSDNIATDPKSSNPIDDADHHIVPLECSDDDDVTVDLAQQQRIKIPKIILTDIDDGVQLLNTTIDKSVVGSPSHSPSSNPINDADHPILPLECSDGDDVMVDIAIDDGVQLLYTTIDKSVIVSPSHSPSSNPINDADHHILSLECSDDDDDVTVYITQQQRMKIPHIISTDIDDGVQLLNTSINKSVVGSPSHSPITVFRTSTSPKVRPPAYRFPTPYKSKDSGNLSFDFNIKEAAEKSDVFPEEKITLTTLETKDIILRSIRRRSNSVCINGSRKANRVTFHSPSNMVTVISDIDQQLVEKNSKIVKVTETALPSQNEYVTKRRKRSMSVDETDRQIRLAFDNLKKNIHKKQNQSVTPKKIRKIAQPPTSRTKLPNFAAIHEQNFKKMESISDHMTRKAERAKIISSSGKKSKSASDDKGLIAKNKENTATIETKPKARQKIQLSGIPFKPAARELDQSSLRELSRITTETDLPLVKMANMPAVPKVTKPTIVLCGTQKSTNKPKPKQTVVVPLQSLAKPRFDLSTHINNAAPLALMENRSNKSLIVPSTALTAKPKFNLSTMIQQQSHPIASAAAKVNLATCTVPTTTSSTTTNQFTDRRQRLMEMYKGRTNVRTEGKKRRDEILRGVRTNRRFELQMKCRNDRKPSTDL